MNKVEIAYFCDGHDHCSLEPGCFLREDPLCKSDWVCCHTLNPEHAATPLVKDPENYPERFVRYDDHDAIKYFENYKNLCVRYDNGVIKYFEKGPGDEI